MTVLSKFTKHKNKNSSFQMLQPKRASQNYTLPSQSFPYTFFFLVEREISLNTNQQTEDQNKTC